MLGSKQQSGIALAISLLFLCTIFANANAYSTGIQPIDEFRADSFDVYQLITFNYTVIGGGGSHIQTIKSEGRIIENFRFLSGIPELDNLKASMSTFQDGSLGSEDRWELVPEAQYLYNVDQTAISKWDLGVYDYTNYSIQRTDFTGYQEWNDINQYVRGENESVILDPQTYTGTQFVMNLLPPEDIAIDWCSSNGAILNSIDNVNTTIVGGDEFVDFLYIQESTELIPDTNLNDGYDIIPVNASDFGISAIIGLIFALSVLVLATSFLVSAFTGNSIFDFSTTNNFNADQTINVNWSTPELNETALYQQYLEFCSAVGQTPTVEGYYEWSKNHFDNINRIAPKIPTLTMNNNWTGSTGSDKKNILTSIIGFIGELIPIIIIIVIGVAFLIAGIMIFRMMRRRSD